MTTNQDKKIESFFCKPASRYEELEIAERLLANGVGFEGWLSADARLNSIRTESGFCFIGVNSTGNLNRWKERYDFVSGGTELTIQQVRERYPFPDEEDQTIYVTENKQEFVPEVGQECESLLTGFEYRKGKLNYKSEQIIVWIDLESGSETATSPRSRKFRPLKTEAEIEREKVERDAKLYGIGFMVAGKHVPFEDVVIFKNPEEKKPEAEIRREKNIDQFKIDVFRGEGFALGETKETVIAIKAYENGYIKPRELNQSELQILVDKLLRIKNVDYQDIVFFIREIEKHIKGE